MRSWESRAGRADAEWRMERERAETVPCPSCRVPAGQHCRNTITGDEVRFPAHPARITEAGEE